MNQPTPNQTPAPTPAPTPATPPVATPAAPAVPSPVQQQPEEPAKVQNPYEKAFSCESIEGNTFHKCVLNRKVAQFLPKTEFKEIVVDRDQGLATLVDEHGTISYRVTLHELVSGS